MYTLKNRYKGDGYQVLYINETEVDIDPNKLHKIIFDMDAKTCQGKPKVRPDLCVVAMN